MKLTTLLPKLSVAARSVPVAVKTAPLVGRFSSCTITPVENILLGTLDLKEINAAKAVAKIPEQMNEQPIPGHYSDAQVAWAVALGNISSVLKRHEQTRDYLQKVGPQKIDHFGIRAVHRLDILKVLWGMGYSKQDDMDFKKASLEGSGLHHPRWRDAVPMYFVSQYRARIGGLDRLTQVFAEDLHSQRYLLPDTPTVLDVYGGELRTRGELPEIRAREFIYAAMDVLRNNYQPIAKNQYEQLIVAKADALAWIATNGQNPNHVAITVSRKELVEIHKELSKQYGEFLPIQESKNTLLLQTANKASLWDYTTADGEKIPVPGPFLEFCAREKQDDGTLFLGFDVNNADQIFNYSTVVNGHDDTAVS